MMDNNDIAIKVEHLGKTFHAESSSKTIKEAFVSIGHKVSAKNKKENKTKKGDYVALRDINFEVKKGEFFGIVGRNGSGKSTLLKLLAGVYTPTKGVVTVNGKLTPFIELGVGFNPELSGRDNVYLNAALLGFSRKQTDAIYNEIVEFAELSEFMDTKLKNYSSGMQVRLAFSVAIRAESDILLIDEVLAVGDAAFQQKCFSYFEELKRKKQTVVFVTHDMGSVRRFCDNAIYINKGKLIAISSPAEIADLYTEQNIEKNSVVEGADNDSKSRISLRLDNQTASFVRTTIQYTAESFNNVYVGISVSNNGVSIGEINTLNIPDLKNKGSIGYELNIDRFNPGVYEVTAALFNASDRNLIAIGLNKSRFIIKGEDNTRGGSLKLEESWIK